MKKLLIFILLVLSLAIVFTSCKEDDKKKLYESLETAEIVKDASGLEYAYLKEYDAYVLVDIGDCTSTHINISAYINGKPVIGIQARALAIDTNDGDRIHQVYEITVPDTVRAIDDGAFQNNMNLNTINIGTNDSSLEGLGQSLLNQTKVNTINFKGTMSEWKSIDFPTQKGGNGWNCTDSHTGTLKVICTDGVIIYGTNGTGEIWEEIPNNPPVDEHNHNWSEWEIVKEATLQEEGTQEHYCSCGQKETQSLEKLKASAGLEFALTHNNTYAVTGMGTCTDAILVIPNTHNGLPVTEISYHAFDGCDTIEKVVISDSVILINENAFFECESLKSVVISNSVKIICTQAFAGCISLEQLYIPASVEQIVLDAFGGCISLMNIEVSKENQYFKSIDGNLYSKDATKFIMYAAGKKDTSFVIPNTVQIIDTQAFDRAKHLNSIIIPDSVITISSAAFYGCEQLDNVIIPNSVTTIEDCAFIGCYLLTNIQIGSSVQNIDAWTFAYCFSLISIDVNANNPYYQSIDGNLYSKDGKTLVRYAPGKQNRSFIIPNFVTTIGEDAFFCSFNLQNIQISNSVTSIGLGAFYYCTSLTSITIPDSVTSIGDYAFGGCSSLENIEVGENNQHYKSIDGNLYSKDSKILIQYAPGKKNNSFTIPNSVISIGYGAFEDCTSLTSVTIPDSVTSIGEYAFENCTSLTIYCEAGSKPSEWRDDWNSYGCPVVWDCKSN